MSNVSKEQFDRLMQRHFIHERLTEHLIDILAPLQPPSVQQDMLDLWNAFCDEMNKIGPVVGPDDPAQPLQEQQDD